MSKLQSEHCKPAPSSSSTSSGAVGGGAQPPAAEAPRYSGTPKVYCLGDSLTQGGSHNNEGWVTKLQRYFLRRADVVNRGLSGYNARWVRRFIEDMLEKDLGRPRSRFGNDKEQKNTEHEDPPRPAADQHEDAKPLFATLWLGANDACLPEAGTQHVPLGEFAENLEFIAKLLLDEYVDNLIILTPPCIAEQQRIRFTMNSGAAAAGGRPAAGDSTDPAGAPPTPATPGDNAAQCEQEDAVESEDSCSIDRVNEVTVQYRDEVLRLVEKLKAEISAEEPKNGTSSTSRHGNIKKLACIDTYELFWAERAAILQLDGLHFGWQGEQMIFEEVEKIVSQEFGFGVLPDPVTRHFGHGRAVAENLPMVLPYWNDPRLRVE
ncbi:unnamed protein product [Amoebophrya sp. A120]|nr:unnamed protein product [Amoebophrya sp. A120]|eukprot:GSA120T00016905001.1